METIQIQQAEIQQKRKRGRPKKTDYYLSKHDKIAAKPAKIKLSVKKVAMLKALERHIGVVTPAAKEAGITRNTHYSWLLNDPLYYSKVEELKDLELDFFENALKNRIRDGSDQCTLFAMRCKGKQRGYVDKQSVEVDAKVATSLDLSGLSSQELEVLAGIGSKILSNKDATEL